MIVARFTNGDFQQFASGTGWHVDPAAGTISVHGPQDYPGVTVTAGTPANATVVIATLIAQHVNSISYAADVVALPRPGTIDAAGRPVPPPED